MVAPYAGTKMIPAERAGTAIFIPVTNPLERLNKEVKRRADVVGSYMQIEGMAELTPPLIDADPAKLPPLAA